MESSIDCGLAPPTPYTIHLNVNHTRVLKDHDNITNKIYFADFCDSTVTTTRRKSLPFATSVDWESLGKFDGEDVLQ